MHSTDNTVTTRNLNNTLIFHYGLFLVIHKTFFSLQYLHTHKLAKSSIVKSPEMYCLQNLWIIKQMETKLVQRHFFLLLGVTFYAHPNVKGSSEVVQIGLNEADVFQTKLSTTTLSPHQGLFFVLYEEDLE